MTNENESATPPALRGRLLGVVGALALLGSTLSYWEGDRTTAYRDMGGVWTICRGITGNVHAGQVATQAQCEAMNTGEAARTLQAVDEALVGQHPDRRRVALADFAYNVGISAFRHSTALRKINDGDIRGGCDQLLRWVYVQGRVVAWQVKRRAWEREWCLEGRADAH